MKRFVAAVAAFAAAGAVFAAPVFQATSSNGHAPLGTPGVDNDATGDTYDNAITGFSTAGGAFLNTPAGPYTATTFPTVAESMGTSLSGANIELNGSVASGGGVDTYTFEWRSSDFSNLIPAGANIGGAPVTNIGFELGENNAGTNDIDLGVPFTFNHPAGTPPRFNANFDLLGPGGAVVFSGTYFVQDTGNGFSGIVFINAGGADLSGFGISGGRATISVTEVPEPASLGLLALGGLALIRRR